MSELRFSELNLIPEMQRAIDELGFDLATDIQASAIPRIREGRDLIGRSQTGTGKTLAFAIPAVEAIDRDEAEPTVQVIILCPTRELAQQGCDEIRKLTRFMRNVWVTDVYGGAPMDKQIARLRRCNLVIGTPGRVMDHMRRGTLSLANVKLVVLDEADEMLSMGFREDIETILRDVPEAHQTVLFSATMPAPILELAEEYLREPHMIEINREQVTLENIRQLYADVPMGRKLDALNLFLRAWEPRLCMIFCNTKLMVEEVTQYLSRNGFAVEALHGDLNQSQRTRVMEAFKSARVPLLVATDVAARGIDVNDIDYVINYDVPNHDEYYVHRIGRTGRAGKEGCALTICSGRRQLYQIRDLARMAKSEIQEAPIPKVREIREKQRARQRQALMDAITDGVRQDWQDMTSELLDAGCDLQMIASAAMQLAFDREELQLTDIAFERRSADGSAWRRLILSVGRSQGVTPNHIVSAIASAANISGREIGKIEIYDDWSAVGVPAARAEFIARKLRGLRINGHPTTARLAREKAPDGARADRAPHPRQNPDSAAHADRPKSVSMEPARRGKLRLSAEAKARLLDGSDLSRFEIQKSVRGKQERPRPKRESGGRQNRDRRPAHRSRKG